VPFSDVKRKHEDPGVHPKAILETCALPTAAEDAAVPNVNPAGAHEDWSQSSPAGLGDTALRVEHSMFQVCLVDELRILVFPLRSEKGSASSDHVGRNTLKLSRPKTFSQASSLSTTNLTASRARPYLSLARGFSTGSVRVWSR